MGPMARATSGWNRRVGGLCAIVLTMLMDTAIAAPTFVTVERPAQGTVLNGASGARDATARASFASLPVEFEVNQGQHDPSVRYLARARGYQMFLTGDGAVLAFRGHKTGTGADGSAVQLRFSGAHQALELVPQELSEHKTNYLVGDEVPDFRTDIPNYARVLYRQVYPGIDVAFYGKNGVVEYDLLLQPGADPGRIELEFAGAEKLELDASGDLLIHTAAGVLTQHRPAVFQEQDGKREFVGADYRIVDDRKVRLQLASYDPARPLTVDPVLSYSTYIGGSGSDSIYAVAVDASGSAYVTGESDSTNFPVVGAYKATISGSTDVVVSKLNAQGTGLVYSTYIGGKKAASRGAGVAVDASGNAYVVGYTSTNSYPTTTGAFSGPVANGGYIVTKLNAAGNGLVFSTYLKIWSNFNVAAIRVDGSGNVIVAGKATASVPTTAGAFQTTNPSPIQTIGFVTKLNPTGSALVFASYLGGSGDDSINGVALDPSGNIYVTGFTTSSDFPTTSGAFQPAHIGGQDAFVAKINPTGSTLLYSTYLGGTSDDSGNAIAVDASGRAFVTGDTYSTDFPRVNGPLRDGSPLYYNVAFITGLSADGSSVFWSGYWGGDACMTAGVSWCNAIYPIDVGTAIATDSSGTNVYVAGYLSSIDVYFLKDPIQKDLNGSKDAFVLHLQVDPSNPGTFNTRYATRLGGSGVDTASGLALDPQGNVYIVGTSDTADFPTTKGAFRVATAGGVEGFVAKLSTLNSPVTLEGVCTGSAGTVSLRASTALNATGNMTFTNGTATLATVPIVNGLAGWSGPLPAGVYKVTATRVSDGATSQPLACYLNQ